MKTERRAETRAETIALTVIDREAPTMDEVRLWSRPTIRWSEDEEVTTFTGRRAGPDAKTVHDFANDTYIRRCLDTRLARETREEATSTDVTRDTMLDSEAPTLFCLASCESA